MAKATLSVPAYAGELAAALKKQLRGADVRAERVLRDRFRFIVVWKKFNGMGHPERQRLVWDIAEQALPRQRLLDVAMILTIATDEIESYAGTFIDS